MASVWRRGSIYYITYENRYGKRVTMSSKMRHERDAQTLANQLVTKEMLAKHGVSDGGTDKFRTTDQTPLTTLLDTWRSDLLARDNTDKYASEQRMQAAHVFRVGGMEFFPQITASAVQIALGEMRKDRKGEGGEVTRGHSLSTLNHYLRSVKAFCRWLWRDGRVKADPVAGMRGFSMHVDRRRERRPLTVDEARALFKAADNGKTLWTMTGRDRGTLYRFMLGTGLRVNEVRTLRAKNFLFDEAPPIVLVSAAFSKRRREDRQPMRENLARIMKKYLKEKGLGPESAVFPLPDKPNRMLQHDLAAAKIKPTDDRGRVLDLHGFRHTYITECARQFPPKITQQLARHSSIVLTMDFYTHFEADEVNGKFQDSAFMGDKARKNPRRSVG